MGRTRLDLDTRILTVFFLVAIPFVALGSFVVIEMARGSLQEALGESFEQRAIETKLLIERYFGDQVVHLRVLSLDPGVQQALATPVKDVSPEEQKALEAQWVAGDPKAIQAIVGSPLAGHLRALMALRPEIKLMQLADGAGRLVASTRRSGTPFYGDHPWFRALREDPLRQEPFVGNIGGTGGTSYLDVAYPIRDANDGHLVGALRVAIDWSGFYGILAPVRVGRTGRAVLLRNGDGAILVSDIGDRRVYPGFAALQAALQGFPLNEHADQLFGAVRRARGYWTLPEERSEGGRRVDPARIVGFARVDQVPGADWVVAVEQDLKEAVAPIQGVTRYLWIHFIGAFGTVILLALYFSFKTEAPVIAEKLHLHEEHVPRGVPTTT